MWKESSFDLFTSVWFYVNENERNIKIQNENLKQTEENGVGIYNYFPRKK